MRSRKGVETVGEIELVTGVEGVALSEPALHPICEEKVGEVAVLAGGMDVGEKACRNHFHELKFVHDSLGLTCGDTRVDDTAISSGFRATVSTNASYP